MSKWPEWWQRLTDRVRQSPSGEVELSIEEVRAEVGATDRNVDKRWWWEMLMNPDTTSHTGLIENGLECELHPGRGDVVERVTFRLAE